MKQIKQLLGVGLILAALALCVPAHAQTVIFQDKFTWSSITAGTTANGYYANTSHNVLGNQSCTGMDYPTCAVIQINSGDGGNQLMSLCAVGAGDCTSSLNLPTEYYTYYKMKLSSGATFGSTSANFKFMYFKNGSGGNVCYYDGIVDSSTTFSLRTICDNQTLGYGSAITTDTNVHTLEVHYKSGSAFELRWDGVSQGAITPTSQTMNWVEPGLYMNTSASSTYTIQLNNFEICTGTWCSGGTPTTYTIGGTVTGLTGTGMVLQDNSGDNLSVSSNGSYTFPTALSNGAAYSVTVLTQPSGQTCVVSYGSGTVSSSNVTNANVSCPPSVTPGTPLAPMLVKNTRTVNGTKETVSAGWIDKPNTRTGYFLWGASGNLLKTGTPSANSAGSYSFTWSGSSTTPVTLELCNAQACTLPVQF